MSVNKVSEMEDSEHNPHQSPQTSSRPSGTDDHSLHTATAERAKWSPITVGVVVDASLLIISSLVLDGGRTAGMCMVAMVAHWIGVLFILVRRWRSPTETDLLFIRYGILICGVLVLVLAPFVWEYIGPSTQSGIQRWFNVGR